MSKPVNVICMKWGTKFNGPYVNNLFSMVQRHLTIPHRFVCFTDDNTGFLDGVESFPLPLENLSKNVVEASWNKVAMFSKQLADLEGPTLFLDLDVLIVNNIDGFFEFEPGAFCMIDDWIKETEGNSSTLRFEVGKYSGILDYFLAHQDEVRTKYRGDQTYTSEKIREIGELHYWPKSWCCSFKHHCLPKWPMNWWQTATLPRDAKIIIFHGIPNPHEAQRGTRSKWRRVRPVPWIKDHWRTNVETS